MADMTHMQTDTVTDTNIDVRAAIDTALAEAASHARAGRFGDAIARLQPLARKAPDHWPLHAALVDLHEVMGAHGQAAASLQAYLHRNSGSADAWLRFAGLLQRTGHPAQALEAVRASLALRGDAPQALHLLGCLSDREDPAAADAFARAMALAPGWNPPRRHLAALLRARGDTARALALLREATRLQPDDQLAWMQLAETQLEQGDDAGWDAYAWRFDCGGRTPQYPGTHAPFWDGRPLQGEIVMVWLEQGLGDQLQFCRYLQGIVAAGGRVWLQTPHRLRGLLASLGTVERFFDEGETPQGYDLQIPLLSLPHTLRDTWPGMPTAPYLYANAPLSAQADALLAVPPGTTRIGLMHASRPDHPCAAQRDCPLPLFAPLADLPGLRLYDLQFGGTAMAPDWLTRIGHVAGDFAHTAAIVDRLDLVITVDTAMAHLCGALGRQVWVLLPTPCDWRWRRDRDDSPWYPSMRLYRQARSGDWSAPLARIAEHLRTWTDRAGTA